MKIDFGLDGISFDGIYFLKYGVKFLLVLYGNSVIEYFCDIFFSKFVNLKLVISCSCFLWLGFLIFNLELGDIDEFDIKLGIVFELGLVENGIWFCFFFLEKVCFVVINSL